MHVHHAIQAFGLLLQIDELDDRAKVIAEMQVSGGLNARKYALACHDWPPMRLIARWESRGKPFEAVSR
jgi:hypothetical protein